MRVLFTFSHIFCVLDDDSLKVMSIRYLENIEVGHRH